MPNGAKRWCFTINMAEPEARNNEMMCWGLAPSDGPQGEWYRAREAIEYLHFQEEEGEEGTRHLQGFLILKQRQTLAWLKKHIHARAHWEVAKGTNQQADDYTRKEETRVPDGMELTIGKLPERAAAGKASERLERAAEELDLIKEGYKRPRDVPSMTLLQCGFIPAYKELTADILGPYRPELKIITMVGPPACGKSYCIQKHFPGHGRCICGNNGVWFQQPLSDVMVFEEFCGQIQLQRMLQYLDPYPLALEVKGGMRPAMYTLVIITSNTPPNGWYTGDASGQPGKRADALLALWDRIGFANGGYLPARQCGHYLEAPQGMSLDELRNWFDRSVYTIVHGHEPISDDEDEEMMDTQEERRLIGY